MGRRVLAGAGEGDAPIVGRPVRDQADTGTREPACRRVGHRFGEPAQPGGIASTARGDAGQCPVPAAPGQRRRPRQRRTRQGRERRRRVQEMRGEPWVDGPPELHVHQIRHRKPRAEHRRQLGAGRGALQDVRLARIQSRCSASAWSAATDQAPPSVPPQPMKSAVPVIVPPSRSEWAQRRPSTRCPTPRSPRPGGRFSPGNSGGRRDRAPSPGRDRSARESLVRPSPAQRPPPASMPARPTTARTDAI